MPKKSGAELRTYLRRINAKKMSLRFKVLKQSIEPRGTAKKTAQPKNILKFGKLFLSSFPERNLGNGYWMLVSKTPHESSVGVMIDGPQGFRAMCRIGFSKNSVIVEAIQSEPGHQKRVEELNQQLGAHWPNVLLNSIESHARELGFDFAAIRGPETMHYYKRPLTGTVPATEQSKIRDQVLERMQFLKKRLSQTGATGRNRSITLSETEMTAIENHHNLKERMTELGHLIGNRLVSNPPEWFWTSFSTELGLQLRGDFMRRQIKNFYSRVAHANGYRKKGTVFVKSL